ncbi:MAG: chorismate synthase [Myxococcota bacterium]
MPGNTFGAAFRVTTFGESHGPALGVVIDGLPAGLALDLDAVRAQLARRRPGGPLASQRQEADEPEVLSGLFEGRTIGTPLTMIFRNTDARPDAYDPGVFRPSHADWTWAAKHGHRDWRGGGRASARETVARVAAGAVARQLLAGVEIVAWVHRVGDVACPDDVDPVDVDASPVRCPHPETAAKMEALVREVRAAGDTIGGVVRCVCRGVPPGLGEPVFDKLEADLAKAMLSIPAAKGFESGSGYAGASMRGSEHNDAFVPAGGSVRPGVPAVTTRTNRSGGIQGGISNGMPVTFSVAFKPVATIFREQDTVDVAGEAVRWRARGRHDPCVLPRAVPVVEAMTAIVLADHWQRVSGSSPDRS